MRRNDSAVIPSSLGAAHAFGASGFGRLGLGRGVAQLPCAAADPGPYYLEADDGPAGGGEGLVMLPEQLALPGTAAGPVLARAVSCGDFHSALLTTCGALLTCGRGECGRLGHGDAADRWAPEHVAALADARVLVVSCGDAHTVAATVAAPHRSRP